MRNGNPSLSQDRLKSGLAALAGTEMVVIGDAIIDRYIWGDVERISPEAPVPVLDVQRAEDRLGGAANVANNLAQLGVAVSLVALVGADDEAESLRELLGKLNVEADRLVVDESRCTTVKTRVMAGQQQIVRIDHEVRTLPSIEVQRRVAEIALGSNAARAGVLISDYGKGVVTPTLLDAVELAVNAGTTVLVDPHPSNYGRYRTLGMCKPNRKEAESATGIKITDNDSAARAARALIAAWNCSTVLLSLGAGGVCIVERAVEQAIFLPTKARQVFDVSGAGDTLAAVFAAAKHAGLSTEVAGELANLAASVVVSQIGTVPVTRELLLQEIEQSEW